MKLGKDVLVEIMNIIQSGLMRQVDVSEDLREIDLIEKKGELVLSLEYLESKGRDSTN